MRSILLWPHPRRALGMLPAPFCPSVKIRGRPQSCRYSGVVTPSKYNLKNTTISVRSFADAKPAQKKSIVDVINERIAQEKEARIQKEANLSAEEREKAKQQRIESYLDQYYKHRDVMHFVMPNHRNQARNQYEYDKSLSLPIEEWRASRRKHDATYQKYIKGEFDAQLWSDFMARKPIDQFDRISEEEKKAIRQKVDYYVRKLNAEGQSLTQPVPVAADVKKRLLSDYSRASGINYSSFEAVFTAQGYYERYFGLHNQLIGKTTKEEFDELLKVNRPNWKQEFEDEAAKFKKDYDEIVKRLEEFDQLQKARLENEQKWDQLFMPQ